MKIHNALQAILDAGLFSAREWEIILGVPSGSYNRWLTGDIVPPPGALCGIHDTLKEDVRWDKVKKIWKEALDEELPYWSMRRRNPDDTNDFPYEYIGATLRHHLNRPTMNGIIRIFQLLDAEAQAILLKDFGDQVRKARDRQDRAPMRSAK